MIPVMQDKFGPNVGNCLQAVIAALLEMPLTSVPNFDGDQWWNDWQDWLEQFNRSLVVVQKGTPVRGFVIGVVPSPRMPDETHAVIMRNGRVIFDPHPSQASMEAEPLEVWAIALLDPKVPA